MENRKEFVWFPAEESEWVLCQKLSRTDSMQLSAHRLPHSFKWQSTVQDPCWRRHPSAGKEGVMPE